MLGNSFAAYFLPFPDEGHQVDLLPKYVRDSEVVVDSSQWPECADRIHGWTGELHFLCVSPNCALNGKRVQPKDCQTCPVRCGR